MEICRVADPVHFKPDPGSGFGKTSDPKRPDPGQNVKKIKMFYETWPPRSGAFGYGSGLWIKRTLDPCNPKIPDPDPQHWKLKTRTSGSLTVSNWDILEHWS